MPQVNVNNSIGKGTNDRNCEYEAIWLVDTLLLPSWYFVFDIQGVEYRFTEKIIRFIRCVAVRSVTNAETQALKQKASFSVSASRFVNFSDELYET